MAYVIGLISKKISEALENRDTRLDHLPLTSPLSVVVIAASYMYFVKVWGPSYMSKRKPFVLENVILFYNLIQIILNAALLLYGLYAIRTYLPDFNFACQPLDWGTNPTAMKEAESVYYYYCLKLLDFFDTVFFVLKKRTRQVSFLHVYHHLSVLLFTYKALGWSPGGQFIIVGMLNCLVHAIMYTYYLFSVFNAKLKTNVTIKKMVTTIQMIQFLLMLYFFARPLLNPDCSLPKIALAEVVLQNVIFIDTRLDHLPLTSPLSVVVIAASYMYFVKVWGPSYMSKRKPFVLENVIIVYNLIQIILNAALLLYGLYSWRTCMPDFNLACQPLDWGTNATAIKEAESVYYYYCLKLLDICDTVFFVLKKRTRQVSFLHVYHHLSILLFTYKALGWSPGGHFIIVGMLNCLVHAIMYTYYLFSVFNAKLKTNVTIKKMVTTIQMIQFLLMLSFFVPPLLNPDCPLPKIPLAEVVLQNVIFIGLFSNFYYRNYCVNQHVNQSINKEK